MQQFFMFLAVIGGLLSACHRKSPPAKFILPDQLREVSGLYYAGPDSLWWHNDSSNRPCFYRTDEWGVLRSEQCLLEADNIDWEDVTADSSGRWYAGDFGNNANERRDLRIYIYEPRRRSLDTLHFRYPDQTAFPPAAGRRNFNMEAFFWFRDSLHLFSKNKLGSGNYLTKHYVLPARPGQYVAELRDSLRLDKRVVTGAAISPDGKKVALVSYFFKPLLGIIPLSAASVYIFEDFPGTYFLRGRRRRQKIPKGIAPVQYEAIDFVDDQTVIVGSEHTILFRQKARRLHLK